MKEDSLNRFLPNNGNNVQESSQLFRTWPTGGPQELWRAEIGNGKSTIVAGNGPILDGNRLYVFPYEAENDDFWKPRCPCFCLNIEDGSVIWSEQKEFNCSEGSTPVIVNDVLYVGGGGRENILAAVDKRTGKLLWKVPENIDAGHPIWIFTIRSR
jgi:hypothetical protein